MTEIRRASVRQLAHKIKGYGHSRFAVFLGAGASVQSGIITASEMTNDFKRRIIDECCPREVQTKEEQEQWLTEQDWYKKPGSEYCKLFEQCEPKEIGRQRYIEDIIEGKEPSFGYVVLANLMASQYINTIITTNFDDLVYSSCSSFTSIRPIVYAYGVLASEMRITAQRTKILKLHGDYLYSALKNTDEEIAAQDPNMARQLQQVLSEYGLIVIGYGGNDKSIMDVLDKISEKNDLYWCVLRGTEPNDEVRQLLISKGGFLVEIEGFDEMMDEIRQVIGFDVGKMFGSLQERQDQMIEKLKSFAPRYSVDILSEVVEALRNQAEQLTNVQEQIRKTQALDYFTRAYKAQVAGNFKDAEELYRKSIELNPDDDNAYNNLGTVLEKDASRQAETEAAYRKATELDPKNALAYRNLSAILSQDATRRAEAEAICRKAIELDPKYAVAYTILGHILNKDMTRRAEAEAAYRKAIELNPKYVIAYNNLILFLRLQSRYAEVLPFIEQWLQLDPKNFAALVAAASTHKKLGDKIESSMYAAQAREQVESDDWYNSACLESVCDNADAAIEHLKRAAQENKLDREWARRDPDLEWIRHDPRFTEIVGQESEEKAS